MLITLINIYVLIIPSHACCIFFETLIYLGGLGDLGSHPGGLEDLGDQEGSVQEFREVQEAQENDEN